MERTDLETTIAGWGVDRDPARRPAYPMEKAPPDGTGAHWDVPEQQRSHVEVFQSIERPGLTAVYGTTCPPRGVSGVIRRGAYRLGEGRLSRWMLLLFADRVDVVEGLLEDLRHGHVPNLYAEMGLGAEWKYNRRGVLRRALKLGGAAASILILVGIARRRRGDDFPS